MKKFMNLLFFVIIFSVFLFLRVAIAKRLTIIPIAITILLQLVLWISLISRMIKMEDQAIGYILAFQIYQKSLRIIVLWLLEGIWISY